MDIYITAYLSIPTDSSGGFINSITMLEAITPRIMIMAMYIPNCFL